MSKSGTLVARRLWGIFFSETNREHWVAHLMRKHDLDRKQADLIMNRIHYLPASKRKPFDTYWTLSSRRLVHTEFPDHQENVRKTSQEAQFNLEGYNNSISHTFLPEILERLNQMEDFQKAYEINPELTETFKEAGIFEDFGLIGLTPEDWSQFGPVQKRRSPSLSLPMTVSRKRWFLPFRNSSGRKRSLGKKGGMKNKSKKHR